MGAHVCLRARLDFVPGGRIFVVVPAPMGVVPGGMMAAALTDADLKDAYRRAQALTESETPQAQRIRQAFHDAAPFLREFKTALERGDLMICAQCVKYAFADLPRERGRCQEYGEAWPFVPFRCGEFLRREKKQV